MGNVRAALSTLLTVLTVGAGLAHAESKRGTATAAVGGKTVTVDYGRPSLKGRPLADLILQLPEDRIWRAGDDQVTTLTSETDFVIGDKRIPAGKFSMYVHLSETGTRSLVVNKDLGIPLKTIFAGAPANLANEPWPRLDGYTKNVGDKEVARVAMKKESVSAPVDTFTIEMAPTKSGAVMTLSWGEERWSVGLEAAR